MADFEAPSPLEETQEAEDPLSALMALAREQEKRRQQGLERLRAMSAAQSGQAQGLRGASALLSAGQNPLIQGLQRELGSNAAQLEGLAAQAGARADSMDRGGVDPLGLARLQQLGEYQKGQLAQRQKEAEAKAQAAKDRAAAGAARAQAAYDAKLLKEKEKQLLGNIKLEGELRKEVQGLPAYKNYQLSLVAFDQIREAAKNPSPAGDIAVITNYMRSLDPTTGVKEQEFNNAQNAGGFDDKARAGWERIMSGKRLSPEQRKDFVMAAEANTRAQKDPYDRAIKYYEGLAERYNVDPRNVAAPVGVDLDAPAAPAATRTPAAKAMPTDASGALSLEDVPAPPKPARVQYNPARNRTRELDAAGKVIREYDGAPNGRSR